MKSRKLPIGQGNSTSSISGYWADSSRCLRLLILGFMAGCGPHIGPIAPPKTSPVVDDSDPARVRVDIVKNKSMPFVVDWNPENRGDLEIAARHGPAIVRFDETNLELLPDCHAEGAYQYAGFTPKGEFKTLRSRAELHANLPVSAATLEARLRSSGSLSIAIRMVGKHELDRPALGREQLTGKSCAKATHYVRRLTVGAFRFLAGESRDAAAEVGVLGAKAGGAADAASEVLQYDGDFKACDGADVDAGNAPAKCRAVLRIELVPLDTVAQTEDAAPGCGDGLRWDGNACMAVGRLKEEARSAEQAGHPSVAKGGFECNPQDGLECLTQCKQGNLLSCTNLGWHLLVGSPDIPKDETRATTLWRTACENGNEAKACTALNIYYSERQDHARALVYGSKGCLGGDPSSCTNIAVNAFFGYGTKRDRNSAFKLWTRACKMRDFQACNNAGVMILWGMEGVHKDQEAARVLFERACSSPGRQGCGNLSTSWELGLGGPKDLGKAIEIALEDCPRSAYSCVAGGLLLIENSSNAESHTKARELFDTGCELPPTGSCLSEKELREYMPDAYSADGFARRACEDAPQSALSCYNSALMFERGDGGAADLGIAKQKLDRACQLGLKKACRAPLAPRPETHI